MDVRDLAGLVAADGPFLTVAIPAPSGTQDAAHRFDVECKNALGRVGDGWDDVTADLAGRLSGLSHDVGEAIVAVAARSGPTIVEVLDEPITRAEVMVGPAPRLTPILDARQRARPHVLVDTDRTGADIYSFDGGQVLRTDVVDGETLHVHRGHPGGWSQRRFQQRAENTWERNADDVAEEITRIDEEIGAELVLIAGDVRARHLVLESLPSRVSDHAVLIEAGSPDAIADETVRHVADLVAREIRQLADTLRTRQAHDTATTDVDEVLGALDEARVEHLLVHDDGSEGPVTERVVAGVPEGARVVDAAISAAIRTDAAITAVPTLAAMRGPVAALLRW